MKSKRKQQSAMSTYFKNLAYISLCAQLVTTATYFNAYFTNPLVNKIIMGQYLAVSAWFFYLLYCVSEREFRLVWSPFYVPGLALSVWAGVRALTAPNPSSVHHFFLFMTLLAAFPLWITCFREKAFRSLFTWTVFMAGGFVLLGCLRQLFMEDPKFLWSWFPALTLTPGSYERQRLGSFLGHNNASSAYLWISTLYAGFLWYRYRKEKWSLLFPGYIILAIFIIILGGSRGVALMIPPALFLLIYAVWHRFRKEQEGGLTWSKIVQSRQFKGAAGLMVLLFIVLVLLTQAPVAQKGIDHVLLRFQQSKEDLLSGTYPRVWLMSLLMAKEKPLTGVGFGSWPYAYPFYQEEWFEKNPTTQIGLPKDGSYTQRGHNDFLQLWAELGLPGLLIMLWLLFLYGKIVVNLLRARRLKIAALVGIAATLGTLIRALFGFPYHEAAASCLFLANLGYLSYHTMKKERVYSLGWLDLPWKGFAVGGACLLVFTFVYHPIHRFIVGDFTRQLNTRYKSDAVRASYQGDGEREQSYYDRAHEALKQSIDYLAEDGEALYELGKSSYYRGRSKGDEELLREAIEQFEESKVNYSFYDQYNYLGKTYEALWEMGKDPEDLEKAEENYQRAVSIYPIFYEGWTQIITLLGKSGQIDACIERAFYCEQRFPGFIEKHLLAKAEELHQQNNDVTAGMLYDIAAVVKSEHAGVFQAVVDFYHTIGRLDMVAHTLRSMGASVPKETMLEELTKAVWLMIERGQLDQAYSLMGDLREKEKLRENRELWYYSGYIAWMVGNPWDSVYSWTVSHRLGVPKEQISEPVSLLLPLVFMPASGW